MAESGNERKENSHSFKTVLTSGITVDVYCADITKIRCDVIVNSANERLWHAGGLSQIIENAAGPSLQKESDDYVSRKGELRESEVAVTGSGRLPCKAIIHAVGPTWSGEKHRDRCKESLYKTFLNSLLCADQRLQAKSVAVPPISHGRCRIERNYKCISIYVYMFKRFYFPAAIGL